MITPDDIDRLTVILYFYVNGQEHRLTDEDVELLELAIVHAEDVLYSTKSYPNNDEEYELDDDDDESGVYDDVDVP